MLRILSLTELMPHLTSRQQILFYEKEYACDGEEAKKDRVRLASEARKQVGSNHFFWCIDATHQTQNAIAAIVAIANKAIELKMTQMRVIINTSSKLGGAAAKTTR